jgi:DNA mismatch repair protein MutL
VDVLLVDDTWIVHADAGGIIITDQHALHERVMFSDLRRRIAAGSLMQQRFLVPQPVAVPPEAIATLEALAPLLQRLGIEATPAGPRSIAIHAFPVFLLERRVDPATFMAQILADEALVRGVESGEIGHAQEAALADVLDMKACKAAVKAGDRLSRDEAARLIADGAITDRGTHCPHGRPTAVHIPLADIERRFGRR